ncbi:MAG: wax ester/triacylglycerol synthase family O-acyltransferase, partial [Panacagrimonas sp.]
MLRLSPLDTMFLFLERRNAPSHVGVLGLFRPPENATKDFGAQLAKRLNRSSHAVAPFDRHLVSRHGLEFWESDSDLDLGHHFVHLTLPKPGRTNELPAMVARLHSTHLDRAYPLWCTYLIDGLDDGRIATYSKIHHSMVDGVAGISLMLKGMSPDALTSARMPAPWDVKPKRKSSGPKVPAVGGCKAALGLASRGMKLVPAVFNQLKLVVKDFRAGNPDLVTSFQAPRTSFNRHIAGSRRFAARSYSRPRIKALGTLLGGTTNDVVLALCAAALRRYLSDQDALPDAPLIAMVPVSIRRDECEGGNEVAVALVNLATHLADPLQRFHAIKGSIDYGKERVRQMTPAQVLVYSAAMMAPGLLTLLPGVKPTIANIVILHMSGPREPMYWQGCLLEGLFPASLLLDGLAEHLAHQPA